MEPVQVAGIVRESIVDGPGLRFVLFVQGCPHRCPGCHNPQTHDPAGGGMTSPVRGSFLPRLMGRRAAQSARQSQIKGCDDLWQEKSC